MSNGSGTGVPISAAMSSHDAAVVRRQLPANDVIGRSHGNGDARRGSDEVVRPGRRRSATDIAGQSSADVGSRSTVHSDNVHGNVSHASHLLTACMLCLIFTA